MFKLRNFIVDRLAHCRAVLFVSMLALLAPAHTAQAAAQSPYQEIPLQQFSNIPVQVFAARGQHILMLFESVDGGDPSLSITMPQTDKCQIGFAAYRAPPLLPPSNKKYFIDGLVPIEDEMIDPRTRRIAVVLTVPEDHLDVRADCRILYRSNTAKINQPLDITVWRFAVPKDLSIPVMANLWMNKKWFARYGVGEGNIPAVTDAYMVFMRDYKINGLVGYADLNIDDVINGTSVEDARNFSTYRATLNRAMELGYTRFRAPKVPGASEIGMEGNQFEENAKLFYPRFEEFLKENKLEDKFRVKVWDEPKVEEFPRVAQAYAIVKKAAPAIKTESTGHTPAPYVRAAGDGANPPLKAVVDSWVVASIPENWTNNGRDVAAARKAGMETWLYANALHRVDNAFISPRFVGWYLYDSGSAGYYLWSVNYWPYDPWTNAPVACSQKNPDGDCLRGGTFIYPHPLVAGNAVSGMPLTSLRLEMLRNGLEDYQYLKLLEEAVASGKISKDKLAEVRAEVKAITLNMQTEESTATWKQLEALRVDMGRFLDRASGRGTICKPDRLTLNVGGGENGDKKTKMLTTIAAPRSPDGEVLTQIFPYSLSKSLPRCDKLTKGVKLPVAECVDGEWMLLPLDCKYAL